MENQEKLGKFMSKTRDWHIYNLAKTNEKKMFLYLLKELCDLIPEPVQTMGRPRIPIKDLTFTAGLKLYTRLSGRTLACDLENAKGAKFISSEPHYNTFNDFMNCPATYDLFIRLLQISALPLQELEDAFSIDSSGFGTYQYERWKKFRFSPDFEQGKGTRNYLKGHICIGTNTHIVTACEVTYGNLSDVKQAPELLNVLARNFKPKEVSCDAGYSSKKIHQIIEEMNATPYIFFKSNANPSEFSPEIWKKMYLLFKNEPEKFKKKYHKRSNVESVFSMVKMRLGEFLKSKNYESQRAELMMKFIVHNICCLIQQIFQNSIKIDFKECEDRFERLKEEHRKLQGLRAEKLRRQTYDGPMDLKDIRRV
ncbi:MAG: transposase [Nanoarchaeota archaeon]